MTGVRKIAGEFASERYPGYLERPNGVFRKPRKWVNPQGKERCANSYYMERPCDVCGSLHLSDMNNKAAKRRVCGNKECFAAVRSVPDGTTKRKRGPSDSGGHLLAKATNHPAAKKGFVPQHRLVVEKELGRMLDADEFVHHINCIKDDNRPENLVVCRSHQEHFLAHGSLYRCVATLIDCGVLTFNRDSLRYEVRALDKKGAGQAFADAALIATFGRGA